MVMNAMYFHFTWFILLLLLMLLSVRQEKKKEYSLTLVSHICVIQLNLSQGVGKAY